MYISPNEYDENDIEVLKIIWGLILFIITTIIFMYFSYGSPEIKIHTNYNLPITISKIVIENIEEKKPIIMDEPTDREIYVTAIKGDTLSSLAFKYYKDKKLYYKIYNSNRDTLKNPNSIQIGQVLKIPI